MVTRRHVGGVVLVALMLSSGCVGFIAGQEPLTFTADAATVAGSAAQDAGYESNGTRTQTIEREVTVAGQTRTVVAENKVSTYEKRVSVPLLGDAKVGVFSVIATPAVEVAGRTFNPVGDYSNDRLVNLVASRYDGVSDVQRVSDRTVTTLGAETTVTKYDAKARFQGRQIDVFVHVTKVRSGDDFVVAVGLYPQRLDREEENILSMVRALEHPA